MLSLVLLSSFASAATLTAGSPFDGTSTATSVASAAIPSTATLRWAQWCSIEVDSSTDVPCLALGATAGSTAYSAIVLDGACPSGGDCLGGYPILFQTSTVALTSVTYASTWSVGTLTSATLSQEALAAIATNSAHTAGSLNISNGFFAGAMAFSWWPSDWLRSLEMAQAEYAIDKLGQVISDTFSPWGDADGDHVANNEEPENDGDADDDGLPDDVDITPYGHYNR